MFQKTQPKDNQMIKDMKKHMLIKLNNRYTESQENLLSICSLLDIRYKQKVTTNDNGTMLYSGIFEKILNQESPKKSFNLEFYIFPQSG